MAKRGSRQWKDNISIGRRAAARRRGDSATTVDEYERLLQQIERGQAEDDEDAPLAQRMRTIDFETMAPRDIVVTRSFRQDDGA